MNKNDQDHHANQGNPNNDANKAGNDNRSNQMNPNNDATKDMAYPQNMEKYCAFLLLGKPYPQNDGLFESFPLPILRYIFKTATSEQWKKLHKTCKFLFYRNPYILVDYLDIADWYCSFAKSNSKVSYYNTKYFLQYDKKKFEQFTNIWASNIFLFNSTKISISTILPKISRCEIKDLRLTNCTMTEGELHFLTKWGKIERFLLTKVLVYNFERVALPFEDVFSYAPYAHDIRIDSSFTTAETSKKLVELKRTRKFKKFCIEELDGTLDHELIYEFIKKNAGINSYFCVEFFDDPENTDIFAELLKTELSKLNWESLLIDGPPTFPCTDSDGIYHKFDAFWKRVHDGQEWGKDECCNCWDGKSGCASKLYKDESMNVGKVVEIKLLPISSSYIYKNGFLINDDSDSETSSIQISYHENDSNPDDEIYANFGVFWKHIVESQKPANVLCGCWYGKECESIIYKGDAIIKKPPTMKQQIWYFFVKKSRPFRTFLSIPVIV